MAVSLNTLGTKAEDDTGAVSTLDQTMTVAAGSNIALVTQLLLDISTVSGITVKWDPVGANQSMSLITETTYDGTNGRAQLWGLTNPTPGASKVVRASWTTDSPVALNSMAFDGVDQTFGTAFIAATPASGTTNPATITISTVTGNATMDLVYHLYALSDPSQTQDIVVTGFPMGGGGGSYQIGGDGSIVHSWTCSNGSLWVNVGVNIVAAGGGGPAGDGLMWLA